MEDWSLSPEYGELILTIETNLPSGVQEIGAAGGEGGNEIGNVHNPLVSRRARPPSTEIVQRCEGSGWVVTRKSLWAISKDLLWRSSPSFLGGSSLVTNANFVPSGDQLNCCTPCGALVICTASPPRSGSTNTCDLPSTVAKNASRSPAG